MPRWQPFLIAALVLTWASAAAVPWIGFPAPRREAPATAHQTTVVNPAAPPHPTAAPGTPPVTPEDAHSPPSVVPAPPSVAAPPPAAISSTSPPPSGTAAPALTPPATPTAIPAVAFDSSPNEPPRAPTKGHRSRFVIKLVLGFSLLFAIAYLGGHPRIVELQHRIGISGLIAAGFPFVALGVIARQPEIGLLTEHILERIKPILYFGLGWLGFIIGAQLDIRLLDRVPRGTAYLIIVEAMIPFAATAAVCGGLAIGLGMADIREPRFWRDVILLGAAAAMTAPRRFRGFANRRWREGRGIDILTGHLDEIVGVVGLLFVAAYIRPDASAGWQIPGTAWVFVTIGLGVVVGVLIFTIVRVPTSSGEFLAVVLGSVALGSGLAGTLFLSPIVVCFIAGAMVNNLPCEQRDEIFRILNHLERPIHLLFLIVVGASWSVTASAPWLLVPAFVVARIAGKWLGVVVARSTVSFFMPASFTSDRVLVSALSPLSIALVLSRHGAPDSSDWITTVVIGGAILAELAVQLTPPPGATAGARNPDETGEFQLPVDTPLAPRPPTIPPPSRPPPEGAP